MVAVEFSTAAACTLEPSAGVCVLALVDVRGGGNVLAGNADADCDVTACVACEDTFEDGLAVTPVSMSLRESCNGSEGQGKTLSPGGPLPLPFLFTIALLANGERSASFWPSGETSL